MRKRVSLIVFLIFSMGIAFFSLFGKNIRDACSPHVKVMSPRIVYTEDGTGYLLYRQSCFTVDPADGRTTAFALVEDDATGEKAYFAQKVEVELDEKVNDMASLKKYLYDEFIYETDRPVKDGDRLVIEERE